MAGGSGQQAEEDRDRRSEVRGQRTEDIEDVGGWRSGPAGLEVGGKIRESVVRCRRSIEHRA